MINIRWTRAMQTMTETSNCFPSTRSETQLTVGSVSVSSSQVTSLSYSGVKEMVRRRGNFQIVSFEKEETDDTIRAVVVIRDLVNNVEFMGASEADKNRPFAFVLAINKAERNAYRKAMPTEFLAKMVDRFLHGAPTETPPQQTQAQYQPKATPQTPSRSTPVNVTPPPQPQPPTQQQRSEQPEVSAAALQLMYKLDSEIGVPQISEQLEYVAEETQLVVKPKTRLEKDDFKTVCKATETLGGAYDKLNSQWTIPYAGRGGE